MVSRVLLISANCCTTSDPVLIEKILKHLGLWDLKVRPASKGKVPSVTISIDDSDSQVLFSSRSFYPDPDDSMGFHRISEPHGVTPMVAISAETSENLYSGSRSPGRVTELKMLSVRQLHGTREI